jgi:steroid delta-isomerase
MARRRCGLFSKKALPRRAVQMKLEGAVRIAGNQAAAAFIVRTVRSRPIYRVETLDVMSFDDAGLITEMVAYWGPENFAQED